MDGLKIDGTLPVALTVLDGQTTIKSKKVIMQQMTSIGYLQAQASIEPGQFIAIADLAAMTKLIDKDGKEYALTYDIVGHSSRANLDYLNDLKAQLDAKERAES